MVTATSLMATPPFVQREAARADDHVAIEVLGAQADGAGDRHLAAQLGLVHRAARIELHAAGRPTGARAGWPRPGTAAPAPGPGGRTAGRDALAVQAPLDDQVAAVGLEVRLVEHDAVAAHADVQRAGRLDADAADGDLAVRPFDGARHRQPQLGQQHVQGSGRPGSTSTVTRPLMMPRASPNATSSGPAPRSRRAGSRARRERAGPWAPAPPARRCRSDRTTGRGRRRPARGSGPTGVGDSVSWPAPAGRRAR
jgi:hypothetical protein